MRNTQCFTLFVLAILVTSIACSNGSHIAPDITNANNELPLNDNQSELASKDRQLLGQWTVEFNLESLTAEVQPARESDFHLNVTPYLPAPGIHVNSFDPVTEIIDVDVTIQNPTTISVNDVRLIIYTDAIGHLLVNDDNWTTLYDIPGGHGLHINPFLAYNKDEPQRKFLHQSYKTENLQIVLPGGNPFVQFAIDASIGGNCEEPYLIDNFTQRNPLYDYFEAQCLVSVNVDSWDDDVESVHLECSSILGIDIISLSYDGYWWEGIITNNMEANKGTYQGHIWAYTSQSSTLALHDIVEIVVSDINIPPVCDGIITDPPDGIISIGETIDISIDAYDPNGDNLTYEWDLDWDEDPGNFDVDATGPEILEHSWDDQGFYTVGCRITDDHALPETIFCSRFLAQEGYTNENIRIDNSPASSPFFWYQDTVIVDKGNGEFVCHVVWVDYEAEELYYCNNADDPKVFGNYQMLRSVPTQDISYACIACTGMTVLVMWKEVAGISTNVMAMVSEDSGSTFSAPITVYSVYNFDSIGPLAVCPSTTLFHTFYVFIIERTFVNYPARFYDQCMVKYTFNDGYDWQPDSPAQFRDSVSDESVYQPHIETTGNIIHVFWKDYNDSPPRFYYDWRMDLGDTWHTDIDITQNTEAKYASMAVDDSGNGYFVWQEQGGRVNLRKSTYGDPPSLGPISTVFNGSNDPKGIDIWITDDGSNVVVPFSYDYNSNYMSRYYHSIDGGDTFNSDYLKDFGTTWIQNPRCDALWNTDPNRITMFNTYLYNVTGASGGRIYGEYIYLVE